jgi:hypothetical protein
VSRRLIGSVGLIVLVGAACGGGRTPLLPGQGQGLGNGGAAGALGGGGDGGASNPTQLPTHFTGPEVQSALASCDAPHGPAVNLDTADEESTHVVGTWLLCPTPTNVGADTMFAPAIQFRADGTFNTMTASADGGLDTGTGLQRQGKWSAFCEMSSDIKSSEPCHGGGVYYYSTIYVWIHVAAGNDNRAGCAVGPISFERSPTRAYVVDYPGWCDVNEGSTTLDFWLVPLP